MTDQQKTNTQDAHIMEVRYQRAQTLIQGFTTQSLVQNDTIFPTWIEGTECFWYERSYQIGKDPSVTQEPSAKPGEKPSAKIGKEYRLVNAMEATNQIAFDHKALAEAIEQISDQKVDEEDLPISHLTLTLSPLTLSFSAFDKRWQFDTNNQCCTQITEAVATNQALSPDGGLIAFARDYNLWIRNLKSGEEWALTNDGEEDNAYGARSTAWGMSLLPEVPALWSPDGTRLLTIQRDKRKVKSLPMVNHVPDDGSVRPTLEQVKVAYPGDKHVETYRVLALDVASGQVCAANHHSITTCLNDYLGFFNKLVWWAADSQRAYFFDQERGDQIVYLVEFNTGTGATRVLFKEVSDTHINILPDIAGLPLHRFLPDSNELIWWSERSGWGHLYLYDLDSGELKHAITSGDWRVREVLHVDQTRRELFIQTSARVPERDPYYRDLCRVNIDSGEITTLLSEDEEIVVHNQDSLPVLGAKLAGRANDQTNGISPNGHYIVTTRSCAKRVPVNVLMDRNGQTIMELEVADISALPNGWQWPEPVNFRAADGKTDLYGLLFRPSDFSLKNSYPVLNYIVSSPWLSVTPKGSFHNSRGYADRHYFYGAALAELGFIVTLIDSRGTPLRSKAFQDESYGWIPASANQEDHIGGLQQLAARYPFMDLNRVGVFAQGYRSGLQSFLERQDFYTVCVSMSVFDNRLIGCTVEGDKFEGCEGPSEHRRYPEQLANQLQGKLLLMHAMTSVLSASYPPAAAFRVIDALQKANKDFDMLMVPNGGLVCNSYMFRRAWDYLVKHLQSVEPPKEFNLEEVHMMPAD